MKMNRFRRISPGSARADHRAGGGGFTLIEITIVLLLIGILSSIAIYTYRMMIDKAALTLMELETTPLIGKVTARCGAGQFFIR